MTQQDRTPGQGGQRRQSRQYRLRVRVRVRTGTVVTIRRHGEHVSRRWDDVHELREVRYAVAWDEGKLRSLVARAVISARGTARGGPITVYVHPADRLRPTTTEREET